MPGVALAAQIIRHGGGMQRYLLLRL